MKSTRMSWLFLPVAFTLHAEVIDEDPYRWLEEVDGKKALAWVEQQNTATAAELRAGALFDTFYRHALTTLNSASRIPQITQRGDYLYNFWRDAAHPRGLYRRTTLAEFSQDTPRWETVLDIDALGEREHTPWVMQGMSCLPPEHRRCLVRLSPGGGDATEIREFDLHERAFVDDGFRLATAKQRVAWVDRDHLYVGTDFGADSMTESGYPRIAKLWRRGTPIAAAKTLYRGDPTSVAVSAVRIRTDDGDIDLINETLDFWTTKRYRWIDDKLTHLDIPSTATIDAGYLGRLIVSLKEDWQVGDKTYPQGTVLIVDPAASPGQSGAIEILVAPAKNAVVEDITATKQGILVTMLENVVGRLYRYRKSEAGWQRVAIDFPDNGTLNVASVDEDSGSFFVSYQSFVSPPTLYYVAAPDWQPQAMKAQARTFDGERFDTAQWWATSADGTQVPYFIVKPKDLVAHGKNPTHIFSYGGFRNSLTPSYSGSYESLSGAYGKLWLEKGGVFVLANIRGGGEFGPKWHAAALKHNRHKAFEDFEAIVNDLIARKITSPPHIGIEGRSNGGLLVGALMTRNPGLYGAVICGVPLLDMRRYHELLAGASWMGEYGDPDLPEDWAYLKTYSPYHNLKPDQSYPAVMFYTSTRDDRVHPGHARKMAAKMTDMGYKIRYYENTEGGHGGSSTNDQLAYRLALVYSHLWQQLH